MTRPDLRQASKFLSYTLRHGPEDIGVSMDAGGWVGVDELLAKAPEKLHLDRAMLTEVVETSDKQRFALSEDGRRIRANQGHSVQVDLGLSPVKPPDVLYHGTATRFVASIRTEGLRPQGRQQVHLSADRDTAIDVGGRHGKPVVIEVDALGLHADGGRFHLAANGVWLIDLVEARYLTIPTSAEKP